MEDNSFFKVLLDQKLISEDESKEFEKAFNDYIKESENLVQNLKKLTKKTLLLKN